MSGNVTSTQAMMLRPAQTQADGRAKDEHSSLAKVFCAVFCTVRMRKTVGWARERLGDNGIPMDEHVGRYVGGAEATHSYEGTREMDTFIVGGTITGLSAFVQASISGAYGVGIDTGRSIVRRTKFSKRSFEHTRRASAIAIWRGSQG